MDRNYPSILFKFLISQKKNQNPKGDREKKMCENKLYVKKLSEYAVLPQKAHPGDAGYDLSSARSLVVPAYGKALVPTDLSMTVPFGTYGRIAPRSGISWKNHLNIGCGVIDSIFTGPVGIVIFNHSDTEFKIEVGDRVAQLIIEVIKNPDIVQVDDLSNTDRGIGGFGSTGTKKF